MKRAIKKSENEDGYVLIVVILLVVLIMGFSSLFMTNAISHTKQEETVDRNHLIVNAAEMGVDYFSSIFNNAYIINIGTLENKGTEELNNIIQYAQDKQNIEINIDYFNNKIKESIAEELKMILSNSFVNIEESRKILHNYEFSMLNNSDDGESIKYLYYPTKDKLRVSGEVVGYNTDTEEQTVLMYSHDFLIPDFEDIVVILKESIEASSKGDENQVLEPKPVIELGIDIDNLIKKNTLESGKLKLCENLGHWNSGIKCKVSFYNYNFNNKLEFANSSEFLVENDFKNTQKDTYISDSIINIIGNFETNELEIQNNKSVILASLGYIVKKGDLKIGNSAQVVVGDNLYLEKGSLRMSNNSPLLVVGESLHVNEGLIDLTGGAQAIVGYKNISNLDVKKALDLSGSSKLTVTGEVVIGEGLNKATDNLMLDINGNSSVMVGSDLKIKVGNFGLSNSTSIIGGSLKIDNGTLDVNSNSILCIGGDLEVTKNRGNINISSSKVYVKGSVTGDIRLNDFLFTDDYPSFCELEINPGHNSDNDKELPNLDNIDWKEMLDWKDSIVDVTY